MSLSEMIWQIIDESGRWDAWLELDTDLRERLREVLEDPQRPVTEAELRKLSEEVRACTLILGRGARATRAEARQAGR